MLLHPKKLHVHQLLSKQRAGTPALTTEETLNLQTCEATFLMSIGNQAVKEIQARHPKDDFFNKDLVWIKEKWQESRKSSEFQNQNFVEVMQAEKENLKTIYHIRTKFSGLPVKCDIDSMSKSEIEHAIQASSFTIGVKADEVVKSIGEKKLSLDKVIKDSQEASQIF